ncbi:MFS transporter [Amycolatopsis nigrescens]|uniref:MFS transporter n=1 Tax=Amycolatopsis nigrescens TaxID=381445 RepID=UPI000363EA5E|nr:MFS transporter [Amycolatopsis nigrescens]
MTAPDVTAATETGAPVRLGKPRRALLLVIGSLYLVSSVGFSFFFLTLGTILLGRGVPLGTVALLNLFGMIYFGRFLLGPVVDRFGSARFGHYRGWLILTQLALVLTLVGLAGVDPVADLPVLMVLVALVLALSVFHDLALNGLAVRLLRSSERGVANGIQVASGSASMLIGSGGALLVYAHAGWAATVLALAAVFVLPLAVLARLTEPAAARPEHRPAPWRELAGYFRRPRMAVWALLVIPVFSIGEWLATAPQSAMLLAADWPMDRIALVQLLAAAVQMVAALGTGAAITRYGRWRPALGIGALGVLTVAALFPLAAGSGQAVPTALVLVGVSIVYGAKLTVVSTVSMDLARESSAATDFTVPMSIEGICVTAVSSAGLGLAGAAGFSWLIGAAVALSFLGAVVGPLWIRRHGTLPAVP